MKRQNINRYFFPDEWIKFINSFTDDKKKFIYITLLNSGARIEEALNLKPIDFDYDRNTMTLRVTKIKAKIKERKSIQRSFVVSSEYIKLLNKFIKKNNLSDGDYLFLTKNNLEKYNSNIKFLIKIKTSGIRTVMQNHLKKIGIEDYYNFSLHNIRKTHGMWLKTLMIYSREISEAEICLRLGHNFNTYLKHYASPSIFNDRDKQLMIKELGNIYGLK